MSRFRHGSRDPEHLVEDAELRVQRAQNRLDRQRKAVAALERADQDTTKAKRFLRILEKALAIHVADRDRLTNDGWRERSANLPSLAACDSADTRSMRSTVARPLPTQVSWLGA